MKIKFFPF